MTLRERASLVCVERDRLLCVALEDPKSKATELYLPGGAIEAGETPETAAVRETREETGYVVKADPERVRVLRYPFVWDGKTYDCITHFFPGWLVEPSASPDAVNDVEYHRGVHWLPLTEVPERFGYHEGILREILALLPIAKEKP